MTLFAQPPLPRALRESLPRSLQPYRTWLVEHHHFLRAWLRNPRAVGAMAPSGRALAQAITRHVGATTGPVLELGCGTGVFTRALLAQGVAEHDLLLVERDAGFAQALRERFPMAVVLEADAGAGVLRSALRALPQPGAAICGLPLLNMAPAQQVRVMHSLFSVLRPGAALYLFSYGPRSPLRGRVSRRLGLEAELVETVFGNLPPARVWRVLRRTGG